MKEEKNYHSRLYGFSMVFDEVINVLKSSYVDQKYSNWMVWLLLGPFRDIKSIGNINKNLIKIVETNLFISLFPFIGLSGSMLFPSELNPLFNAGIGFLVGYLIILPTYFSKLLKFDSGHFHTGAYRVFRKQEYNLFKTALLDERDDFYFKGLYDYMSLLQTGKNEYRELYSMIEGKLERHLAIEKNQLETKVFLLKDKLKRTKESYEQTEEESKKLIEHILMERTEILEHVDYIAELIKDITTLLFRLANGIFSTKDLNIISGFTIYEKQGINLVKIEDVGTSGSSPITIPLTSNLKWGVTEVLKSKVDKPIVNKPYQNRTIVSYKMNMGLKDEKTWIYNFHFDSDNKKVNHLLVNKEIIDPREVYRLIHSLCLISQNQKVNLFTNHTKKAE
ncbi:hypothetical protein M3612_19685 [Niallia taxi]|uniref:hypothetical protein n=1 Tax=Niallia taxi TaxID=2499688 RepID=UPI00203D3C26|nr:hypothetical protein [Niallia taxi]MCM3216712.1 hypothetical protein [Niallia taxi]